jgi:hypothetical protein
VPANLMNDGLFSAGIALTFSHSGIHVSFYDQNSLNFAVVDGMTGVPTRSSSGYSGPIPGVLRPLLPWSVQPWLSTGGDPIDAGSLGQ